MLTSGEVGVMSTTIRTSRVITRGEPLSRGRSATGRRWWGVVASFLRWAAERPDLTVASLVLAYLATLAGVVAVLTASASGTIVGTAVLAIFAAEVLVFLAIAVYTVIPERSGSFDR
jgi:hypothetical protein